MNGFIFFFTTILFLNFFLIRNAWKLCVAAAEQREFLLFPRTAPCARGLQAQKASLLVEHMLQTYTFFDTHYNFEQFHFQHVVLTLLHYPCSSPPGCIALYLLRPRFCLVLKSVPRTSEVHSAHIWHLSVLFSLPCLQGSLSALPLCCSTSYSCALVCCFI